MIKGPGLRRRLAFAGSALLAGLLAALLSGGSCIDTDIGLPCRLVKTSVDRQVPGCADLPADINAENIDELSAANPECFHPYIADLARSFDKDFVSFGATECENLTCVRTRCTLPDPKPETPDQNEACEAGLPAAEADPNGICSGDCITDQDCQTEEGGYVCRGLVLDDEFLQALRDSLTVEEYSQYFGRIQNSKFCAPAE